MIILILNTYQNQYKRKADEITMRLTRQKRLFLMPMLASWIISFLCLIHPAKAGTIQTVTEATCTENGSILTTDLSTGTTRIQQLPAAGHAFTDWINDADGSTKSRTCESCGLRETVRVSTNDENVLPKLYFHGSMEGIGKKAKVTLEAEFVSSQGSFRCYAIATLQGHSTFGHLKRNYTIRFYDDPQGILKHKLQFGSWNPEHKYILKAHYLDPTMCRNLIGAQIWSRMAACRPNLPSRIAQLPTYGAVDGFPVEVYLNDSFIGLYTMNLHKDEDLYGMRKGERAALMICNRQTTDESLFLAPAAFSPDYSSDWELEYTATPDEAWAKKDFNQFIDFVMHSSDQAFRQKLSSHLDVDGAIDYLLLIYALGLPQSAAKDMVLLNYGGAWIPSAYDMDEAFGFDANNSRFFSPQDFLPEKKDGVWTSHTGSLLWDRLLAAFEDEIRARYAFLRRDVLAEDTVLALVRKFTSSIPETLYDMDMNLYPGRPIPASDPIQQITDYVSPRLAALDAVFMEEAQ